MYNSTSIDMHDNFDKALYVISYVLYSGMGMHYPRYYKNTAGYVTGPDALHLIFSTYMVNYIALGMLHVYTCNISADCYCATAFKFTHLYM